MLELFEEIVRKEDSVMDICRNEKTQLNSKCTIKPHTYWSQHRTRNVRELNSSLLVRSEVLESHGETERPKGQLRSIVPASGLIPDQLAEKQANINSLRVLNACHSADVNAIARSSRRHYGHVED